MGRCSRFTAFLRLGHCFVNGSHEEEGAFRQVVVLAFDDFTEAPQRLVQRDVHTGQTGELLADEEWLSSIPMMAMISISSLYRCRIRCTSRAMR